LHIDKVGIKSEDADIVLWNNNPLSIYAKAENYVKVVYYDVQKMSFKG
jgi:imidazolonepropionase-like amidohydrolase